MIFVLLIAAATEAPVTEYSRPFVEGKYHFEEGVRLRTNADLARPEFAKSAADFDEVWQHHSGLPGLALNRYRAHRLAGQIPQAILAVREGLALAPSDRDLQRALESARSAVAYPIGGELENQCRPRPISTLRTLLSPPQTTVVASLLWVGVCLAFTRYVMVRSSAWLWTSIAMLTVLIAFGGYWWRSHLERDGRPLAVLSEDSLLRAGNAVSYSPRLETPLPRGVELRILGERGGWVHVELAGGAAGWLPVESLLKSKSSRQ